MPPTPSGRERLVGRPAGGRRRRRWPTPIADWLAFFEPDERVAPRLGVAVAPSAVAKRMRGAVGLPDDAGRARAAGQGATARPTPPACSRGDLVTDAAGEPVRSIGDLDRAVRAADGTLTLQVLRGAEPHELAVTFSG